MTESARYSSRYSSFSFSQRIRPRSGSEKFEVCIDFSAMLETRPMSVQLGRLGVSSLRMRSVDPTHKHSFS